jgi:hypothetical protein
MKKSRKTASTKPFDKRLLFIAGGVVLFLVLAYVMSSMGTGSFTPKADAPRECRQQATVCLDKCKTAEDQPACKKDCADAYVTCMKTSPQNEKYKCKQSCISQNASCKNFCKPPFDPDPETCKGLCDDEKSACMKECNDLPGN